MGFKRVKKYELDKQIATNFLGVPLRYEEEEKTQELFKDVKQESVSISKEGVSEIIIKNQEFLDLKYQRDQKIQSFEGYGNIAITNNSDKDRIWDARLSISGSKYINLESENDLNLGIVEPRSRKTLKYNISNKEDLPELLKIDEKINILNEEVALVKSPEENGGYEEKEVELEGLDSEKYLLIYGKENVVNYVISLTNTSSVPIENVIFRKYLHPGFYDLKFESYEKIETKISSNIFEWTLNQISPGRTIALTIYSKITPKKKEEIKTGRIEVSYTLKDYLISGLDVIDFSAYSHAMHAINKKEKESEPNKWQCSLIFENHSSFNMKLKSVLVLDESKSKNFMDLDLNYQEKINKIFPGSRFITDIWEVKDENEPKFARKVDYCVDHRLKRRSFVTASLEDDAFQIVGIEIEKEISENEIKSFEESIINNKITIRNIGTIPIKGILVKEVIPEDFQPPKAIPEFKFTNSSGAYTPKDSSLQKTPPDDDPKKKHTMELSLGLKDKQSLIAVDEFLEMEYPLKAITPDYKKDYELPLEVLSYFPKSQAFGFKSYIVVKNELSETQQPELKISHKRRNLVIEKEIFPGRNSNEFAVNIILKNKSNVIAENVVVKDTFPKSFELVSSNLDNNLSKPDDEGLYSISFTIDEALPFQEKEIMYYIKNISEKEVQVSDLESFFYG